MKYAKMVFTVAAVLCFFLAAIPALSAEQVIQKGNRYTVYNKAAKCQMVCKAPKPISEYIEDGLAFALDIPLAILSPLTCPIVKPVIDAVDPVEKRSYKRR